ncbi:MAG: 6-bladed beta-propeller [Balneolales bacterium]
MKNVVYGHDSLTVYSPDSNAKKQIEFIREISFGETEEVFLGRITVVTADHLDRVFMADIDQNTVHVYNRDGSYLTSLGRQGQGPGEFNALAYYMSMRIHSNQLVVTDQIFAMSHRMNIYSLEDLSFSHTVILMAERDFEEPDILTPGHQVYPRNDGTFLVMYRRGIEESIRYFVQDSNGRISGPIFEHKDLTYLTHTSPTGVLIRNSFPFLGKSLLAVSDDDHLYYARTEKFQVHVHDPDGKYLRTFEHPFSNITLDRSELIDSYSGNNQQMIREAQDLPETWPALEEMFFDDENRLWISTIVADDEVYEWWVLKDTGEVIAKFEWPRDEPIEAVNNGYIYTRETEEETGFMEIIRYRIEMEEI